MPFFIPPKYREIYCVLGSSIIESQIRNLKSNIHVYGHSHVNHGKSMNPSPANTLTREFFKMPFQHLIFRQENHFLRNAPGITKIWRVKRPRLPLSIACSCPC